VETAKNVAAPMRGTAEEVRGCPQAGVIGGGQATRLRDPEPPAGRWATLPIACSFILSSWSLEWGHFKLAPKSSEHCEHRLIIVSTA
jgi:hypothetical protein